MNKRILYVERTPRNDRELNTANNILLKLQENYDAEVQTDLGARTIDLLSEEAKKNMAYDALLTHVPYDRNIEPSTISHLPKRELYEKLYDRSLEILKKIKKAHPKMPILIYTGADNNDEMIKLIKEVANDIIFRSSEWDNDATKIKMSLEKLLT